MVLLLTASGVPPETVAAAVKYVIDNRTVTNEALTMLVFGMNRLQKSVCCRIACPRGQVIERRFKRPSAHHANVATCRQRREIQRSLKRKFHMDLLRARWKQAIKDATN